MNTLLFDADHLLYQAAAAAETEVRWDNDNHVLSSNAVEVWDIFNAILNKKIAQINPPKKHHIIMCFTSGTNFRQELYPSYKSGRPRKPLCYWRVLEMVSENFETKIVEGLEADDVMGILATHPKNTQPTLIVSEDKDMKTIPGYLFRQNEMLEISPEEASHNHLLQTLTGDPTDGYPGCPGIGVAKAKKALLRGWQGVLEAFLQAGLTEEDALTQARLAFILHYSHFNLETRKPILWVPPTQTSSPQT